MATLIFSLCSSLDGEVTFEQQGIPLLLLQLVSQINLKNRLLQAHKE